MGSGGQDDKLGFKVVVGLLFRCIRLLRPVRKHLWFLCIGFTLLGLSIFPFIVFGLDVFWTRALTGSPLTEWEAYFLGWAPAVAVHVETLPPEIRRELVVQLMWIG